MIANNRAGIAVVGLSLALGAACVRDRRDAGGSETPSSRATASPSPAAMDHSAMGHGAPAAPASPEAASSTAAPGQPAMTLEPGSLDAPAATSVREAQRAAELAASGHVMAHGTYRHVDAGRDEVPAPPAADPHAGHADPHAGHADPHAGHQMPAPSPSPKENR